MPVFGNYETTRELYRVGGRVVYAARAKDGSGGDGLAVKAQEPGAAFWDEEGQRSRAQALLQAARLQQQVVASGARRWAPVHDYGSTADGQGAYYVTDRYPQSVENLITGRIRLNGQELHSLLSSALDGLLELKEAGDRPHGNLKPSNLLVGKGAASRVFLTDPLPDTELRRPEHGESDLRAFGRLIYQLVLHRELRDTTPWPVESTPEWRRLGDRHEEWLELCNKLLQPSLPADLQTLDDLAAALDGLRGGKRTPLRYVLAGLAVLALAGAGAWFVLRDGRQNGGGDTDGVETWTWFGPVYERYQGERWGADPWLDEKIVTPILGARAMGVEFTEATVSGPQADTTAVKAVDEVKRALQQAKSSWPAAAEMETFAAACAERGWPETAKTVRGHLQKLHLCAELGPAVDELLVLSKIRGQWDALASRVQSVQEGQGSLLHLLTLLRNEARKAQAAGAQPFLEWLREADAHVTTVQEAGRTLAEGLEGDDGAVARYLSKLMAAGAADSLAGVARELKKLEANVALIRQVVLRRKNVAKLETEIAAAGPDSEVASAFSRYAAAQVEFRQEGLLALKARLEAAESVGRRLKEFLEGDWKRVDRELFRPIEDQLPAESVAAEDLENWLAQAPNYFRLSVDLGQTVRLWNEKLNAAEKEIEDGIQLGLAESRDLKEKLPGLRDDIGAFANLAPIAKNEDTIHNRRDELSKSVDDFLGDVPPVLPPGDWLQTVRSKQQIGGSEAVNAEWRRRRDRLIGDLTTETLEADRTRYVELRAELEEIEKALKEIEGMFPPAAELPAGPGWKDGLREALPEGRRAAFRDALAGLEWQDGRPTNTDALRQEAEAFAQFQKDLRQLVDDFDRLDRLLNLAYRPDEAPGEGQSTIAETAARWRDHGVLTKDWVAEALEPVLGRVDALIEADASESPAELLRLVESADRVELVVTAWRRLDEVSWPGGLADLRQALELRGRAQRFINGLTDADRSEKLQAGREVARPGRWVRGFEQLSDRHEIEAALDLRGQFGVTAEQMPAWARYDALLYELSEALTGTELPAEEKARPLAEGFVAAVEGLPDGLKAAGPVAGLVGEVNALLNDEKPGVAPPAGPRQVAWGAWRVDESGFPERVAYSWPSTDHELTFVRVEPDGAPPGYLSTREVSVSLFAAAVEAAGQWPALKPRLDPRGSPRGPRGWEWDGERISTGARWLTPDPEWTTDYPEGLNVPPPQGDCPMHWINAEGARQFAEEVMNCRLPTPAEWRKAAELVNAEISPAAWNLRDETYARQWRYVESRVQEEMVRPRWPNEGVFRQQLGAAVAGAYEGSDGVLWFESVDAPRGDPFRHLIGNVAEFLSDDASRYHVAGGSALSSRDVPPLQPQSLSQQDVSTHYSDIGLRLALSPTGESLAWGLREALREHARYVRSDLSAVESAGR